jgi:hypothetical protein
MQPQYTSPQMLRLIRKEREEKKSELVVMARRERPNVVPGELCACTGNESILSIAITVVLLVDRETKEKLI